MPKSGAERQREYRERMRRVEHAQRIDTLVDAMVYREFERLKKYTGLPTGEMLEVIIKVCGNHLIDIERGAKKHIELVDVLKEHQAKKTDPRQVEIEE